MTEIHQLNLYNLSESKANFLVLKLFSMIKEYEYIDFIDWKYEDISIDDLFSYIKKTYTSPDLKENFISQFILKTKPTKQYDVIEGFFSLIKFFEQNERYEDCIILKGFKDILLLEIQLSEK